MGATGDVIDGRYLVGEPLGRGGMADVFRATDTETDRTVAVKLLHSVEPTSVRRFGSEVEVMARLDHPGLVRLRGSGTHEGAPYLVLDLAGGASLAHQLARGPLGIDRTVDVGAQLAAALAHAHGLDIVHRDVKPSNILFEDTGQARLADFGIARLAGAASMTRTGAVIGSAPYLAPEQVAGQQAGPAADVYSLGLVLIECLTARPCYPGNYVEAAVARLHRTPGVPADIPVWLHDVLSAMTATDPRRRPSADGVAEALRRQDAEPVVAATAAHDSAALAELHQGPAATAQHDAVPSAGVAFDSAGSVLLWWGILGAAALSVVIVLLLTSKIVRSNPPETQPVDNPATTTTVAATPTTVFTAPAPQADAGEAPPAAENGNSNGNGNGNGQSSDNGNGNGRSNGTENGKQNQ